MVRLLTLTLILTATICFSQKRNNALPMPPNCVLLYDSVGIDKTEIANIHWLEYLYYLEKDSTLEVLMKALPDETVWMQYDSTGQRTKHYLRSADLRYYPVVGVSQQQAIDYCKWRGRFVNHMLKKTNERKWRSLQVNYRLPTEKEWELAAAGKLDPTLFPYGFESYFDKPNLKEIDFYIKQMSDSSKSSLERFTNYFNDYKRNGEEAIFNVVHRFPTGSKYGYFEPLPIFNKLSEKHLKLKHATANKLGVTNMIGNVAEMISEKGFSKGGSWAHDLESSQIKKRQYYKKPEAWLGFRCACEVKRK